MVYVATCVVPVRASPVPVPSVGGERKKSRRAFKPKERGAKERAARPRDEAGDRGARCPVDAALK